MDVAGIEPATPCLQSKRKFNLSRCFGCAYQFEGFLRLLQKLLQKGSLTLSDRSGRNSWIRARGGDDELMNLVQGNQ